MIRSYTSVRAFLLAFCLAYVGAITILGERLPDGAVFFLRKCAVVAVFAGIALCLRNPVPFTRAWLPFLAGAVLFDASRGAIYTFVESGWLEASARYPIAFEAAIFGTPALSVPVQTSLRTAWLDVLMVGIHAAHFLGFLAIGLSVWVLRPEFFPRFRQAILLVFAGGLLGYTLVPTVPPWLASSELGLLPPIVRVADEMYRRVPELYATFDSNPVAAMPSLHVAFPAVFAFLAWPSGNRPLAYAASAYLAAVSFAVIYLGDHYVIDLLAGWLLALAAVLVASRRRAQAPPRLRYALGVMGLLLLTAGGLALATA